MFVVYGLLILSILVFVHELGHFLAAKLCKVPVEAFSIGFGKPILKKKIGETEYRLSPIPFGGYVKMVGDEGTLNNSGFNSHPIWQRALIAFAGPAFNFIFAFLILLFIFARDQRVYDFQVNTTVGAIDPLSVSKGIFQVGDSLVSINGKEVKSWYDINRAFRRFDDSYKVAFYRNGSLQEATFEIPLPKKGENEIKESGLYPQSPVDIQFIDSTLTAAKAGLKVGDTLLTINGEAATSFTILQYNVRDAAKDTSSFPVTLKRGEDTLSVMLTPGFMPRVKNKMFGFAKPDTTWIPRVGLGHGYGNFTVEKATVKRTLKMSTKVFLHTSEDVFILLNPKKLVKLLRYMSGPIGIIQTSGKMAEQGGLGTILYMLMLLSINLGILNLLPLVITDGGILFFLLIEAIRKKPVSMEKQELLTKIFFVLFLSLFLFVTFNDIRNYSRNEKIIEGN